MDPIDKLIIVRGVALVISVNFYLHSRDMSSSFSSATAQTPSDKLIASGITFLMDTSTQNVRSNPTLPSLNNSMDPWWRSSDSLSQCIYNSFFFFRVRVRNW